MVPGLRVFWLPSLAPWFSVLLVDSRFVRDPRSRTRGRSVPACPIFSAAFVLGLAEGRVAAVACVAAEDDDVPRIYSVSCSRAAVMVQVSRAWSTVRRWLTTHAMACSVVPPWPVRVQVAAEPLVDRLQDVLVDFAVPSRCYSLGVEGHQRERCRFASVGRQAFRFRLSVFCELAEVGRSALLRCAPRRSSSSAASS